MVHVKWAGPNTLQVEVSINVARSNRVQVVYLSKPEALEFLVELKSFVNFYKEDFVEPFLTTEDLFYEEDDSA